MPTTITLDQPLWAIAADWGLDGEELPVIFRQLVTSDDGALFSQRLEAICDALLRQLPTIQRSTIDHLVAIIEEGGTKATVYVNELSVVLRARTNTNIEAGGAVTMQQIADVEEVDLGIAFPEHSGVVVLFSMGWRKALWFDLGVFHGEPQQHVPSVLGVATSRMLLPEAWLLSETGWEHILKTGWFPFAGLPNTLRSQMLQGAAVGQDLDPFILNPTSQFVAEAVDGWGNSWESNRFFKPHIQLLRTAIDRYLAEDYISTNAILWPRIEGILRTFAPSVGRHVQLGKVTAGSPMTSLYLPARFMRFISERWFASFDAASSAPSFSRHSVCHGAALQEDFDLKNATIALLVVDQFHRFLQRVPPEKSAR